MLQSPIRISMLALSLLLFGGLLYAGFWWHNLQQQLIPPFQPLSGVVSHAIPETKDSTQKKAPFLPQTSPAQFSAEGFSAPGQKFAPLIKWYWPGAKLEELQIIREIQSFADQGFGGIQIQVLQSGISAAHQKESNTINGPIFQKKLQLAIQEAKKRNLEVQWNLPTGGKHVPIAESMPNLSWGEGYVLGGKRIDISLPPPSVSASYYLMAEKEDQQVNSNLVDLIAEPRELVAVFAAKSLSGARTSWPFDWRDQLKLNPDSTFLITSFVKQNGRLEWLAPKGYWKIIAIYRQISGSHPGPSQADPAGFLPNPLTDSAVLNNWNHWTASIQGLPDSLNLDGIRIELMPGYADRLFDFSLLDSFPRWRGYELLPHLPAILQFGADHTYVHQFPWQQVPDYQISAQDHRIRWDYQRALQQQLAISHWQNFTSWSHQKGWKSIISASSDQYSAFETLAGMDEIEVPVSYAGGDAAYLKWMTSAAEWQQINQITGLLGEYPQQAGTDFPLQWKVEADRLLLAGCTRLMLAGSPAKLSGPTYWENSWHPYGNSQSITSSRSGHFGKGAPFNASQPAFNEYVGRASYLLQQGSPEIEILVYYPFEGFPASWAQEVALNHWQISKPKPIFPAIPDLPLYQEEDERVLWLRSILPVLNMLDEMGLSWKWIHDKGLQAAHWQSDHWELPHQQAAAILLLQPPVISFEASEQMLTQQQRGGRILSFGQLPQHQPGYLHYAEQEASIQRNSLVLAQKNAFDEIEDLYNHLIGRPIPQRISFGNRYPFLRQVSRFDQAGRHWMFLHNQDEKGRYFRLKTAADLKAHAWLDLDTGNIHPIDPEQEGELTGYLPGYGSVVLFSQKDSWEVPDSLINRKGSMAQQFLGLQIESRYHMETWTLLVPEGSTLGEERWLEDTVLFDWKDHSALKNCGSPVLYQHGFFVGDTLPGRKYFLDLGSVYGSLELSLNTEVLPACWQSPFLLDVSDQIVPGNNLLEIWLNPPVRNRWLYFLDQGREPYQSLMGEPQNRISSGLLGPVVLWEVMPAAESLP